MRLAIDGAELRKVRGEINEDKAIATDPEASKEQREAALKRLVLTPESVMAMVCRCVRVVP